MNVNDCLESGWWVTLTFLFHSSDSGRDAFAGIPGSVSHGSLRGQHLLHKNSRLSLRLTPVGKILLTTKKTNIFVLMLHINTSCYTPDKSYALVNALPLLAYWHSD